MNEFHLLSFELSNNNNRDKMLPDDLLLYDQQKTPGSGSEVEEISFPKRSTEEDCYYCLCFVDMVGSTTIVSNLHESLKIRQYYSIFLNSIAAIAKNFGARVVKNIGDALLLYFPFTLDRNDRIAFRDVMECLTAVIVARDFINAKLNYEGLPSISYRVSADYGKVEVATTVTSGLDDLFGPTVNVCAKINSMAEPNGIVIGKDLYDVLKHFSFDDFKFKEIGSWRLAKIHRLYEVYSVVRIQKETLYKKEKTAKLLKGTARPVPNIKYGLHDIEKPKSAPMVMLVDDEPDVLLTFKSFLLLEGYNSEAFSDPYQALQSFVHSDPGYYDLIILDIRMPSMNGLQLYKKLKEINRNIKVIFISALEATEELVSILEGVKAVDVMRKPIDREHFTQKVKSGIITGQIQGHPR